MSLLGANGQSVNAERKVYLRIQLIDKQAFSGDAEQSVMQFELDDSNPYVIQRLMDQVKIEVMRRLGSIGFLEKSEPVNPLAMTSGSGGERN